tara:strand:+ start:983 stop:1468 length:486 start_codon:yes stop_codon:yes gene_type:complete
MNYLIATVSDIDSNYGRVQAYQILKYRLNNSIWGLYGKTRNKALVTTKSKMIFYVAGYGIHSQTFAAEAEVEKHFDVFPRRDIDRFVNVNKWLYEIPVNKLKLNNIILYKNPMKIHNYFNSLDYFHNKDITKWWCSLQGGIRPITKHDFSIIHNDATNHSY